MLIVTRRLGEVIVIGDNDVRITVLEVQGTSVRIGVDAPSDTKILREELYLRSRTAAQAA